jgi:flagellin
MAQNINTNVNSLTAQRNLGMSQLSLSTSMTRLSSGLRINSAKDDAAGLAISERMSSQIRGLNQAARNANDAISLSQTAEGALGAITTNLQRMRELSVQSANGTNSASDRVALQAEVTQLAAEIDRVAGTTQFNGQNLLDGTLTSSTFQVGANAAQTISLSVANAQGSAIGSNDVKGLLTVGAMTTANAAAKNLNADAQTLTVSGTLGAKDIAVLADASAKTIIGLVNAQTGSTGVSATATTTATVAGILAGATNITLIGKNTGAAVTITGAVADPTSLSGLVTLVNNQTGTTGITATSNGNNLVLTSADGYDIVVGTTDTAGGGFAATLAGADGVTKAIVTTSATVGGAITFSSSSAFSVKSDKATTVAAATTGSTLTSVASVNISTAAGATSALSVIDSALAGISSQRAALGAIQNRFESTVSNLQTTSENLSASRSRIQDADFASETANLSRAQILQQAGTAMVAQANQLPQGVLALLR